MADEPTNAPETDPAGNGEPTPGAPGNTPPAPTDKAPKWEGEYDPEKAARLVANLRTELDTVKGKLRTREDAEKSELQRAQERAEEIARELRTERAKGAAQSHKIPASLAKFIVGNTAEEIEASAKALAEELGLPKDEAPADSIPGRPKPRLVPGHATGDDDAGAFDPEAVIKAARRGY